MDHLVSVILGLVWGYAIGQVIVLVGIKFKWWDRLLDWLDK